MSRKNIPGIVKADSIKILLLVILFLISIIGIHSLGEGGGARREQESALEILKKKYARGEISKEEFEEKKKDLL